MPTFSRIVAMLVLATFVVSSAGAQALMRPQDASSAGCHGHGSPVPGPVPLSHQCCVTGHSQAIPNGLFSGLAPLLYFVSASQAGATSPSYSFSGKHSTLVSSSPGSPGSISLRI